MKSLCLAAITMVACALPAAADPFAALEGRISRSANILETVVTDLDADGLEERLILTDRCMDEDPERCEWVVLSERETGDVIVSGQGWGQTTYAVATNPRGGVVWSDGVTWAMTPSGALYPYHHLLEQAGIRTSPGRMSDYEAVERHTDMKNRKAMEIRVLSHDLDGDKIHERVLMIEGLEYSLGGRFMPYLIINRAGEMLMMGYSEDPPRIFVHPDGGSSVIDLLRGGYEERRILPSPSVEQ